MDRRKILVASLAVVGALLMAMGLASDHWIAAPKVAFVALELGLRSAKACLGAMCESKAYTEFLTDDEKIFVLLGRLTFGIGIVGAVLLVGGAASSMIGKDLPGPVSIARLSIITSAAGLVLAVAFVVTQPDDISRTQGAGAEMFTSSEKSTPWSFMFFVAGCVAGSAGMAFHSYGRRNTERPVGQTHAPDEPAPPCPQCSAETRWMPQYSRFYCRTCKRYV